MLVTGLAICPPQRRSEKGAARFCDGGPEEGHRRGDAGGQQLPKKHSRDIFVTKLQQSPAFAGRYTCG
jgi:hypothetical protein